ACSFGDIVYGPVSGCRLRLSKRAKPQAAVIVSRPALCYASPCSSAPRPLPELIVNRILSLAVLLSLLVSLRAADPAKEDLDKLQGTWKVVSLEKDGKPQPDDAIKSLKV